MDRLPPQFGHTADGDEESSEHDVVSEPPPGLDDKDTEPLGFSPPNPEYSPRLEAKAGGSRVVDELTETFETIQTAVLVDVEHDQICATWYPDPFDPEITSRLALVDARRLRDDFVGRDDEPYPCRYSMTTQTGQHIQFSMLFHARARPFLMVVFISREGVNREMFRRAFAEVLHRQG